MYKKYKNKIHLLGVLLLTVVIYIPGMSGGFYFDDEPNLLDVTALHWNEFSIDVVSRSLVEVMIPSRPLANLSLGLNHLYSGLNPFPYHVTNLIIHLLVGMALYWVIRLLQKYHITASKGQWIAILCVALFLVHPLNIQAVTYIVQRMTAMATLFFLLGFGCYLVGRHHQGNYNRFIWLLLSLVCLLLSIGSKEIGYLLIPMIFVYESVFYSREWKEGYNILNERTGKLIVSVVMIVVAVIASAMVIKIWGSNIYWLEILPKRDFSGYERVLTEFRVMFFYLGLFVLPLPSRLNLEHDFTISHSLFDPITTILAVIIIMTAAIFLLWNRHRFPFLSFPVLSYLVLHSMEAAPISLEIVFEHRMYQPMTMLVIMIALLWSRSRMAESKVVNGLFLMMLLLMSAATFNRNSVWGEPMAFYEDSARKSQNKFRPQYNFGTELAARGEYDRAMEVFNHSLTLRPGDSRSLNQVGNIYYIKGNRDKAESYYEQAVSKDPGNAEAIYNLAIISSDNGKRERQRDLLKQFLNVAPGYLSNQKKNARLMLRKLGD